MTEITPRNAPLAINPLKASQPLGATLACLGIRQAIPLLHGSQGCSAFAKVFLVQHFREPIPLQTTAMDQVSTVMGGDENLTEALETLCGKSSPALILVTTTGLTETQGTDVRRVIKQFQSDHPEYAATRIVPLNAPDFKGCLESGFALAVEAMIDTLVESSDSAGSKPEQLNLLVSASHTPADIELLKTWVESFGLTPIVLPDISDSLGHLVDLDFSPLTLGGTPVSAFDQLGQSAATLVIGRSLAKAGKALQDRTGVPSHRFDHLMGMNACDRLVNTLAELSGRPVPATIERQRAQLQDAMVDTHFQLGLAPVAVAADPELLGGLCEWLSQMGARVVAGVTPVATRRLAELPCDQIKVGDLADLENLAAERGAELLIGNTHLVAAAERLEVPLLRAGFPQFDHFGAHRRCWIGYGGSAQTLFDIANLRLHADQHHIPVYHSYLSQKHDHEEQAAREVRA
ncbi:nitrogenase iron-molybdenum cofactor biosynthesis protein NifN [Motiliproteus sediminis]|uniref:nitrogenase iron-molybdenum cofactor biosynthesis protein NifN n=1 Tax=Motiliproteus sediminis TaxID=1468178 RepID=UPI001AEF417F|nr:nitrogenase iron-molybdenum cofactor biosynthesis protein NifN [Motiliproteus sediminis]